MREMKQRNRFQESVNLFVRQVYEECCAFSQLAFGNNETIMIFNDLLGQCKTYSGTRKFISVVQTLKNGENPICILLLKAYAIVGKL